MDKKHTSHKIKKVVVVDRQRVDVWPNGQQVVPYPTPDTNIRIAPYRDVEAVNAALATKMLELESNPRFTREHQRGGCGNKIDHIHRWNIPEADLIHARALTLFTRTLGCPQATVDCCWGNIYRAGDYCMPHSHVRSTASLVYMVDIGESDPGHPLSGKVYFADPRLKVTCDVEPDRMTRILIPDMKAGFMVIFPGAVVHGVNPYTGQRSRITLSWNINPEAIPGRPPNSR
jgi:hypothetical protein